MLGGSSDIGLATLRVLAGQGLEHAVLACRDPESLTARLSAEPLPAALTVEVVRWDALDPDAHEPVLTRADQAMGGIDLVLCTVGSLGHGSGLATSPDGAAALIQSNFTGPATALTAAAHHLRDRGAGVIVVITSVAGLRARKSNYLYGSAKAGLDTFTAGLADALAGTGVRVHLVRPGFVHTRMTTGLPPAPFASAPEAVATAIAGATRRHTSSTLHVPALLGPLFGALKLAPRPIWRRIAGDR